MSCARCKASQATLLVRAEHLCEYVCLRPTFIRLLSWICRNCFTSYIASKVLKRLEANKIRSAFKEAPRTLILALSLGISSVTMLHILDGQLCAHLRRSGRTSYRLHILYIDQSSVIEHADYQQSLSSLMERFPSYQYSITSLEDVFDYDITCDEGLPGFETLRDQKSILPKRDRLRNLMLSLPSATSKIDIMDILRLRLTVAYAKAHECQVILYGDTTTRLAERTLSEIAKGRGNSLSSLISDGISAGGIKIIYPMRDILKKELIDYANLIKPSLAALSLSTESSACHSTSLSETTIDGLMSQYFESVEQNYPSIVANVVRTSSKLVVPSSSSSSPRCVVCDLPILHGSQPWGDDQTGDLNTSNDNQNMVHVVGKTCYGCARSIENIKGTVSAG